MGNRGDKLAHRRQSCNAAELRLGAAERILAPSHLVDIRRRSIPFHDIAKLVAQRLLAEQEPAVLAIEASEARFRFAPLAGSDRRARPIHQFPEILGMNCAAPTPT